MRVAFVVPCYNEAERTSFNEFKKWQDDHPSVAFYFVNDGSTDKTLSVLREHFLDENIIDLSQNQGKAEAVRQGMKVVSEKSEYDYIGFLDADLATPLSEIPKFLETAEKGKNVIIGSRILRLGGDVRRKWYRHYLGRLFATVASVFLDLPVYDTQCGAKLFKTNVLKTSLEERFISKWIFDVELLFRLRKSGVELEDCYEVPLSFWEDVGGSRLKPSDFIKAPFELLQLYLRYR